MPTEAVSREFDAYKVFYITSTVKPYLAVISCFQGEQEVGVLRFLANDQPLERPKVQEHLVTMDFHIYRFGDIHRLLLHESPLLLYVSPDCHWGSVTTSSLEPIGEMELSSFVSDIMSKIKDSKSIDPDIAG